MIISPICFFAAAKCSESKDQFTLGSGPPAEGNRHPRIGALNEGLNLVTCKFCINHAMKKKTIVWKSKASVFLLTKHLLKEQIFHHFSCCWYMGLLDVAGCLQPTVQPA